jgi:hypothetical protein
MCFRSFPSLHGTKYRTGTGLRSPLFPLSPLFSTDPSDFGEEPAPSTVDIYGDGDDMEVLEAMRIVRQVANDRWQSCVFRDDQGGFWSGTCCVFGTLTPFHPCYSSPSAILPSTLNSPFHSPLTSFSSTQHTLMHHVC